MKLQYHSCVVIHSAVSCQNTLCLRQDNVSSTCLRAGVPCVAMSPDGFFPHLSSFAFRMSHRSSELKACFLLSLLDQHQSPVLLFCCLNLFDQS